MADEPVEFELRDGIAMVRLNRPDTRNPLSGEISASLNRHLATVGEGDARCLVIEGAGAAFSAGGDIDAMKRRLDEGVDVDEVVTHIREETGRAVRRLFRCPIPTVAKVDGPAIGGGANLALAADVRLASPRAKIGFGFRNVGLAVDTGSSYLLPQVTSMATAKELIFTGRVLDAEAAADAGLVNRVIPADEFDRRVRELAQQIADGPTVALKASKGLLDDRPRDLEAAIAQEANTQAAIVGTDDHREGVEAFIENRDPNFEGR